MAKHIVKKGECLASIARDHGFSEWKAIYDHPKNIDLKSKRPDPNVIHPGDKLFIPDKKDKQKSVSTDRHHRFRRHLPVTSLRLILLDEERNPWANRPYMLSIEHKIFEGKTDGNGLIDHEISPAARHGHLTVWLPPRYDNRQRKPLRVDFVDQDDPGDPDRADGGPDAQQSNGSSGQSGAAGDNDTENVAQEEVFEWELVIGHLDPVEEVSGLQARLFNLGYSPGSIDGIAGPLTRAAVRRFQKTNGLTVDGIAGPKTQARLKDLHGC